MNWFSGLARLAPAGNPWPSRASPWRRSRRYRQRNGRIRFLALDAADLPPIRALMKKYADLPMDLADAALVHVAAREALHTVFTLDRTDFGVYRLPGGRRLRLLP